MTSAGIIPSPALDGHEYGSHHHHHRHPERLDHQFSDPYASQRSQNDSTRSKYSEEGQASPSSTPSENSQRLQNSTGNQFRTSSDGSNEHQMKALRKHLKILEERLRNERHSHAVKFSEVEKSLIQENAKLKVANAALERQVKRDVQRITDLEAEVSRVKKQDKKKGFSLSGVARSFSDVRLDEMEMKGDSLNKSNTESEVVTVVKQRLSDSEKDRLEAESQFTKRISALLRERNLERADYRAAEENIMKLTGENSALSQTIEDLRSSAASDATPSPNQMPLLKRANQQLQEELDQLHREKAKLIGDLENLSEELTLSRANERQNQQQVALVDDMKNKIDSLRGKMASMERRRDSERKPSNSEDVIEVLDEPFTFTPLGVITARKVTEVELSLKQKQHELTDCHRKLITILELSQRYEHHCYNLEKELSKFYGKSYQFVETEWRKRDVKFMRTIDPKSTKVRRAKQDEKELMSSSTQTTSVNFISLLDQSHLDRLLGKLNSVIHVMESSLGLGDSHSCDTVNDAVDHMLHLAQAPNLSANNTPNPALEKTIKLLTQQKQQLEEQLRIVMQNQDDEGIDGGPITQAEIDERILQARLAAARGTSMDQRSEEAINDLASVFLMSGAVPSTNFSSSSFFADAAVSSSYRFNSDITDALRPRSAAFYLAT